jgi:hypothetical protein
MPDFGTFDFSILLDLKHHQFALLTKCLQENKAGSAERRVPSARAVEFRTLASVKLESRSESTNNDDR